MSKSPRRDTIQTMKAILVDSGHGLTPTGANDSGAVGNGTTEREQVREIARRLVAYLQHLPLTVLGVGIDEDLRIDQHIARINGLCNLHKWGPQDVLLVSVHMNAGVPEARGVEGWYGTGKSPALARVVAESLAAETGMPLRNPEVDPSNRDRLGRLGVLDDTIPANAVLIEVGFVTNPQDAAVAVADKHHCVLGIARGVCQFLHLPMPEIPLPTEYSDVPPGSWYHDAVYQLLQSGVLQMQPDGLFHPERPATRAELAVMLARLK